VVGVAGGEEGGEEICLGEVGVAAPNQARTADSQLLNMGSLAGLVGGGPAGSSRSI